MVLSIVREIPVKGTVSLSAADWLVLRGDLPNVFHYL